MHLLVKIDISSILFDLFTTVAMGYCCFSSATKSPRRQPSAKVIGPDGSLSEHRVPVTASKVLGIDRLSCFLCNCDSIQVNDRLSPLDSTSQLQADKIYFVVPKAKLNHRITGADMAALAVKATNALSSSISSDDYADDVAGKAAKVRKMKKKKKHVSFSPDVANSNTDNDGMMSSSTTKKKVISRSLSSGLGKFRRSFRRVLSTVDEYNE